MSLKSYAKNVRNDLASKKSLKSYYKRYRSYSFVDCKCDTLVQFESSITRLYHTIEKGLSYSDYRAGFGKANVDKLVLSLEQYVAKGFDTSSFTYETALDCLNKYVAKNKEHGHEDPALNKRIEALPGKGNRCGGTITTSAPAEPGKLTYEELVTSRHSIRHYSSDPVSIDLLKEAVALAQYTPSACNRQGWRTRIISDRNVMQKVLANQNGNKGFGQELDKLLCVTADLRSEQRNRELFQAFIDGGMYAESILNALYSKGIGSVPLSASLTPDQEKNVRDILSLDDAEVLILFIGVGNYPGEGFLTTRSERRPAGITVI